MTTVYFKDEITLAMDRNMAVQRANRLGSTEFGLGWLAFSSVEDKFSSDEGGRNPEFPPNRLSGLGKCALQVIAVCGKGSLGRLICAAAILVPVSNFALTTTVAHGDEGSWQPRPLALPATSDRWQWSPPEKVVTAPEPVTQIIVPTPPAPVEREVIVPPTPAEIRQARIAEKRADQREIAAFLEKLQPTHSLPPSDQINLGSRKSQLAQEAVEQLRLANWASKRGAIASAQAAGTQTLRTIATLRDSQMGGNLHTTKLNQCFTAIRESADFAGRYGPVDTDAIERLIEVHQTPALKNVATSNLTATRAIEAYLDFAKSSLVNATIGGPLAAEATMILADLETLLSNGIFETSVGHSSLHSAELALMYRRAAVEISPNNADASAELGRTLLKRSIPSAAKDYLLESVNVHPTRQRVEALLEAAALSGDFVLVNQCEQKLATESLPSELPIKVMSPQEFSRTNQSMAKTFNTPPNAWAQRSQPNASAQSLPPSSGFASDPEYRMSGLVKPTQPSRNPSASAGQIVDPTLPAPPLVNRQTGRMHW